MFRKKTRRSANPIFGLFRLILSLCIFGALILGILSAYKHFSGTDPLKLSPKALSDLGMQVLSQAVPKLSQTVLGKKIGPLSGGEPPLEQYRINPTPIPAATSTPKPVVHKAKPLFRFMLIADSHNDSVYLKKALAQAKRDYQDIKFIIGLGDYTEVGTVNELREAKNVLDSSGLRYFVLVGDHDLWDSRNRGLNPTADFNSVFGPSYQSFTEEGFKFILLYDSDNYVGLGDAQKNWLANELGTLPNGTDIKGVFVFLHEPLFHPSSDHFMGRVEPKLKPEAQALIRELSQAGVKKVFAGDTHYFSEYEEPQTKLPMVTVGAITLQRNLQDPRFAIVEVSDDGSSSVEDVEVK